jgi:hypothetical protein
MSTPDNSDSPHHFGLAGTNGAPKKKNAAKIQTVEVEYLAVNVGGNKKPIDANADGYPEGVFQPIEIDHAGTGITFHPLGKRWRKERVPKYREERNEQTGLIEKKKYFVEEWVHDGTLKPLNEGENVVHVPIAAWNAWHRQAKIKKLMSFNGKPVLVERASKSVAQMHELRSVKDENAALRAELARLQGGDGKQVAPAPPRA